MTSSTSIFQQITERNAEVILKLYTALEHYLACGETQAVEEISKSIQRLLSQV